MLEGNFEKAFRVILKLRDVHSNGSFQHYSASALILTALCRQRVDLAFEFVRSLDKDYELKISDNLFALCKYGLNLPVTAKDIMRLAKSFEFSNMNYIKKNPELFEEILTNIIREKYNSDELFIQDFINATDSKKLRTRETPIFANTSIMQRTIDVPLLVENFKIKKAMYDLLETTHNQAKQKVAELRKSGELPTQKESSSKEIKVLTFDAATEKILLNDLNKKRNNYLDRHFTLIALQDFYYKYRDLDNEYLEKCIECCLVDINSLSDVQKAYYSGEVQRIKQLEDIYSKNEVAKRISNIGTFNGNIPAFKRLAIIYEKQQDFNKAIELCEQAIAYYGEVNMTIAVNDFIERRAKIEKKLK